MRRLLAIAACLVAIPAAAADDGQDARRAMAQRLFDAMDMRAQFDQAPRMMQQMAAHLDPKKLLFPPRAMQIASEEAIAVLQDVFFKPGGIKDIQVGALVERFSLDELRQMAEFFESPVGRKLIAEQPRMAQATVPQMMKVYEELMRSICPRVEARLKAEGIDSANPMAQCRGAQ